MSILYNIDGYFKKYDMLSELVSLKNLIHDCIYFLGPGADESQDPDFCSSGARPVSRSTDMKHSFDACDMTRQSWSIKIHSEKYFQKSF